MKTFRIFYVLIALLIIGLFSCSQKPDSNPPNYSNDSEVYCKPEWFPHSQTPEPKEGADSPFGKRDATNLTFHQWSWQKFLWLTQSVNGDATRFEKELILVDNLMKPISPKKGAKLVLKDTTQAGPRTAYIKSNPNYNDLGQSHIVYYSIHINDVLQKAAETFKDSILADPSLLDNRFTFPISSLEIKIAWVEASAIPKDKVDQYYTTEAYIVPEDKKTEVALIAMHVVGIVANHPEFIWATFEHNDLAPIYDWEKTEDRDLPVSSNEEKLLFKKGYQATIKDITWDKSAPKNVFSIYKYGVPKIPGGKFMKTPQNGKANYDNIRLINNCVQSNLKDVWKNYFYDGSIWLDTDKLDKEGQITTLLNLGFNIGKVDKNDLLRGATACANITMETFFQPRSENNKIHNIKINNLQNCFTCHGAKTSFKKKNQLLTPYSKSPLYTSHIFRDYMRSSMGLSIEEIEKLRIKDFLETLE